MTTIHEIIKGLQIVNLYTGAYISAEHDVIYLSVNNEEIHPDDVVRLIDAGWLYDEKLDCYRHFV